MKKFILVFLFLTIGIFAQEHGRRSWDQVDDILDNVNGTTPTFTGTMTVNGTIIGYKDNATSLRSKGLTYYGNSVQDYHGIFYGSTFADNAPMYTRDIWGSNDSMDIEIQGSHAVLITGVTNSPTWPNYVLISSSDSVVFSSRAISDATPPVQFLVDRVTKTTRGASNTSNIELKASTGSLTTPNNLIAESYSYAVDTSTTANAVKITLSANLTLAAGLEVTIKVANANSGAMTLVINSLTSKSITKAASGAINTAMASGDVLEGQIIKCVYDGTQFQIISRLAQ